MHKALRTADIVEAICSFLDARSLEAVFGSCSLWREIVTEAAAWRKLAHRTAAGSAQLKVDKCRQNSYYLYLFFPFVCQMYCVALGGIYLDLE